MDSEAPEVAGVVSAERSRASKRLKDKIAKNPGKCRPSAAKRIALGCKIRTQKTQKKRDTLMCPFMSPTTPTESSICKAYEPRCPELEMQSLPVAVAKQNFRPVLSLGLRTTRQ